MKNQEMLQNLIITMWHKPTRGDWASSCQNDIETLNLKLTFEDIKAIKKTKYVQILKEEI